MASRMITVVFLFVAFFLNGCQNESIIDPQESLNKYSGYEWITLPENISGTSVEAQITKTKTINGAYGGEIKIDHSYSSPRGSVKIIAILKFLPGSFSGSKTISMTVDDINGTVTYAPSMNFNKPAELYLKFENINLNGLNSSNVDFVYQAYDGTFHPISYKEIKVDDDDDETLLELEEGKIPHFSRYGWVKRR